MKIDNGYISVKQKNGSKTIITTNGFLEHNFLYCDNDELIVCDNFYITNLEHGKLSLFLDYTDKNKGINISCMVEMNSVESIDINYGGHYDGEERSVFGKRRKEGIFKFISLCSKKRERDTR